MKVTATRFVRFVRFVATRFVQSGGAVFVLRVEVGALLDQKLGDVEVAMCIVQRSPTRLRGRSGVWAYAAEREEEEG